jgi:diguanylate cyclase (GGDEF)-like protein
VSESEPGPEGDLLARERARVMSALAVLAVVFLIPFAINDVLKGRDLLAVSIVCVVIAFAVDGYAVGRGRTPPIPYALLLVPIAAAITISLATQGVIGAFWCYPAVLFFYFVLPRAAARACSLALLVLSVALVHHYLTVRITVRFSVSLFLTIVIVDVIQDIIGQLQRRLVEQAITDPLTGAFNRRHMETRLAEAVETHRRRAAPAALLLTDVDHFKLINDAHGHKAGDTVLQGVVSTMRKRARQVDLLFRMGGEEFILLLPDTSEDDAASVAESVRQAIADAPLLEGRPVTASIGVGGLRDEDSVESWIKDTDAAMYAAKEGGRNRVARRTAPTS